MTERDAQVGTNGGLSQRWRAAKYGHEKDCDCEVCFAEHGCADEIANAKLRIEEAVKALEAHMPLTDDGEMVFQVDREAVLKIIREIL